MSKETLIATLDQYGNPISARPTDDVVVGHVKVMLSHNYCHFEIQLPLFQGNFGNSFPECVDEIRKEAMCLCDKAVKDYKRAKQIADMATLDEWKLGQLKEAVAAIEAVGGTPENERTPQQKAQVKALADYYYWKDRDFEYDYEDGEDER